MSSKTKNAKKKISFSDDVHESYVDSKGNVINWEPSNPEAKDRHWAFVAWDWTDDKLKHLMSNELKSRRYIICGEEICPTTGRRHLQSYVIWENPVSWKTCCERLNLHKFWCKIKYKFSSDQNNIDYCSKDKNFHEAGERLHQGMTSDVHEALETLKVKGLHKTALQFPDVGFKSPQGLKFMNEVYAKERSLTWREISCDIIYGPTRSGKTSLVYKKHGYENVYSLPEPGGTELWFDGYDGEPVLLIDEFTGWIKFNLLLKILDNQPLQIKIKGGYTYAQWSKVYIVSNVPPQYWYPNVLEERKEAYKSRITNTIYKGFENVSEEQYLDKFKKQTRNKSVFVDSDTDDVN